MKWVLPDTLWREKADLMSLIGLKGSVISLFWPKCVTITIVTPNFLPEQHALRLTAFRQLHKVLGIDPLPPPPKFRGKRGGRSFKRRREDSGQGDEGAKKEKKEGEGESTGEAMEVTSGAGAEAKTES